MLDRSHTRNGSLQIGIMATMGKETQNQLPSTQKPCHSVNLLKDFATQKHCNAWRNSIVAHNGTGPGENLLREALNETRPGQHWFNWAANASQSWNVHNSTQFNANTPLTPTKTSSTIVHAHLFSQQKFISHETTNPSIIPHIHPPDRPCEDPTEYSLQLRHCHDIAPHPEWPPRVEGWRESMDRWTHICGFQNGEIFSEWCNMHNPLRCFFWYCTFWAYFCMDFVAWNTERFIFTNVFGEAQGLPLTVSDCLQSNILSSHQVVEACICLISFITMGLK